jgi:hypothetical protein
MSRNPLPPELRPPRNLDVLPGLSFSLRPIDGVDHELVARIYAMTTSASAETSGEFLAWVNRDSADYVVMAGRSRLGQLQPEDVERLARDGVERFAVFAVIVVGEDGTLELLVRPLRAPEPRRVRRS